MRKIQLLVILLILCSPLFSQEEEGISVPPDSVFIVNSFVFNIDGYTKTYALINKGDLITGQEITGLSNLEKYVIEKTQLLYNERVLESVSINYSIGNMREDGKYPVDFVINVKDTWNMVAIPRPMYSSNSGFEITIKARDYNFLGTMSPLRIDLGYRYDEEKRNYFLFMLDSNIPFRLFDLNWNFKFVNYFNYRPNMEEPLYYKNITGLSVELPFRTTTITAGFDESVYINEENSDSDRILYGDIQEGFFLSSNPYVSWKIPTNVQIGNWGELIYTPKISAVINHEFSQWPLIETRKGPFLTFDHSLGFERIDWIGNFLRGFNVEVYNSIQYDFYKLRRDTQPLSGEIKLSGIGHFIINDFFGVSSRLMYRQWLSYDNGYEKAGDVMRGILDKDIRADYMFSLNLDLPIRVLRFKPSQWFNNQKLRVFNFDLHFVPIIDAALFHNPAGEKAANFDNVLVTGGFEVIIFPDFFRSLFLRISAAFEMSKLSKRNDVELFIGTDLHY